MKFYKTQSTNLMNSSNRLKVRRLLFRGKKRTYQFVSQKFSRKSLEIKICSLVKLHPEIKRYNSLPLNTKNYRLYTINKRKVTPRSSKSYKLKKAVHLHQIMKHSSKFRVSKRRYNNCNLLWQRQKNPLI